MSRRRTGAMAAAVLAGIFGVGAAVTTTHAGVISDTFTVGDGTGTAGGNLNGSLTETGNATWVAETSIKYTANNTIQRFEPSAGNNVGGFAITPTPGEILTITARLSPRDDGSPNSGNFLGIGFLPNLNKQPFWASNSAEIWMHFREGGGYEAFANETEYLLARSSSAPAGFNVNDFNTIELTYNPSTHRVTAKINDTVIVNNVQLNANFDPDIQAVGFHMLAAQSTVDHISVSGVTVPEPATGLGLIGAGVLGLLATRRRRA